MQAPFIPLGISPATREEIFTLPWGQAAPEGTPHGRFPFLSELTIMFKTAAVQMPTELAIVPEDIIEDGQVVLETTPCPPDHDVSVWVWADVQHEIYGTSIQNDHQPMVYAVYRR